MPRTSGSLSTILPGHAPTLAGSILDRVARTPQREAFRSPDGTGRWSSMTWSRAGEEFRSLGAGLLALGLGLEDRVAIASSTRLEWILADAAIMVAGGANTTIYPTTNESDVAYLLADSGSRIMFTENAEQTAKVMRQRGRVPELTRIVQFDGEGDGDFVITLAQLRELGVARLAADPDIIEATVASLSPDSLATLMYTSGTTGRPKGVELPHRCWVFEGAALDALDALSIDDLHFLWLPLSHSFGKVLLSLQYQIGFPTAVDGTIVKLAANLADVQPTLMAGVPRVFEKIHAAANARARASGGAQQRLYEWAFDTSARIKAARRDGTAAGRLAAPQMLLAERLVFGRIRAVTGGRIRYFVSGSAALNKDVARWFDAAGMTILEGYGLTETSAAACLVRPDSVAFGTVGPPIPGAEAMVADDGEILLRGPHIMRGYRNLPEENATVMLPDGWFATGDLGEIDDAGRLRITDRKKDLVKTSGGKYIAPGVIEAQFKALSALAANLVVHANNRNYATGLVSLDAEALRSFAVERGLTGDYATLAQSPDVRAVIQAAMDSLNSGLNRWETIKKFTILPRELSETEGEMTPSHKVRRRVVEEHFADLLDAMYG